RVEGPHRIGPAIAWTDGAKSDCQSWRRRPMNRWPAKLLFRYLSGFLLALMASTATASAVPPVRPGAPPPVPLEWGLLGSTFGGILMMALLTGRSEPPERKTRVQPVPPPPLSQTCTKVSYFRKLHVHFHNK